MKDLTLAEIEAMIVDVNHILKHVGLNDEQQNIRNSALTKLTNGKQSQEASPLETLVSTHGVDLPTLLNDIMPDSSVLFKDALWGYYEDDSGFEEGVWPKYGQEVNEGFEDFIRRVIESLAKEEQERGDEFPDICINLAIARNVY